MGDASVCPTSDDSHRPKTEDLENSKLSRPPKVTFSVHPAIMEARTTMRFDRDGGNHYSSIGFDAIACAYLFASPMKFVRKAEQRIVDTEGSSRPLLPRERPSDARS